MTSRERVLATLKHREPDRVPLDLGGTESSGLTGIAYNRLKKHLGLQVRRTEIFDVYQQVTKIEQDLRDIIRPDTVPLLIEPRQWKPWPLPDGSPCLIPAGWNPHSEQNGETVVRDAAGRVVARMPRGGYYFEPVLAPLAAVERPERLPRQCDDIERFDWPSYADETVRSIGERAARLHRTTDLAVVANLQLHLLAAGQILRGYETFMMDLVANKPLAHALLGRLTEAYMKRCDGYFAEVRGHVDVVLLNDDLGTQSGPMLSLDCYHEMIWPHQRRLFAHVKSSSGALLLFHSCGSVARFIPSLIEAGVDALNPVQVSAAEMDTARLKRLYGRDISFWGGGCDTQAVLARGTRSAVQEEVRRRMDELSPGGGFVFTQVHNIQPDVPPANVMAMLEAFEACRG